jgi:4-methyl-5(b-hydroxyethyl)-thiazole monophosphate biosynthesis
MGAHNIPIVTDCLITEINANDLDMIVLPGGWGGTEALAENETVQSLLKQMKLHDKLIGAICAAPYALDAAGVLNNNYTCYPSIENKIRIKGYSNNQHTVIDGKVMTSQGVGTAICFALEIIKTLQGYNKYQQIKQEILAEC